MVMNKCIEYIELFDRIVISNLVTLSSILAKDLFKKYSGKRVVRFGKWEPKWHTKTNNPQKI